MRSIDYYTNSHGRCVNLSSCRFQHTISDITYCQDNNGEYSDYCKHCIYPENIGCIEWVVGAHWINGFHTWDELKNATKYHRNASFVLPLINVDNKIVLGDPSDYLKSTYGIKGVMYTTDERIKQKYGTRMEFYSYSFLRSVFESELNEILSIIMR